MEVLFQVGSDVPLDLNHSGSQLVQFGKLRTNRFDTLAKNDSIIICATASTHGKPPVVVDFWKTWPVVGPPGKSGRYSGGAH